MMLVPSGVKIHMALGYTDMRRGFYGLAILIQETLKQDPFSGQLFVFRGRRADLLKILYWDGSGLCLFSKRLEQGQFSRPAMDTPGQAVQMSLTQLGMLLEGVNWRLPERRWRPQRAGSESCRPQTVKTHTNWRPQFGRRSKKPDPDQPTLGLEDIHEEVDRTEG